MREGEPLLVSHLLASTGLAASLSEARRLISSGGIWKNNVKVTPPDELILASDLFHDRFLLLRRGKRYPAVVEFTDGEEWEWQEYEGDAVITAQGHSFTVCGDDLAEHQPTRPA